MSNRSQQEVVLMVAEAINQAAEKLAKAEPADADHQACQTAAAIGYLIAGSINNMDDLGLFNDQP